ncbi:MAG: hypothetical protein JRD89_01685 [Deltaproteobacteria bacterium]|nr:hypothetical protein [Deltaproteobacteria bacterium]
MGMQNSLILDGDFERKFKVLLSDPVWPSVQWLVMATRDYENALNTVGMLLYYLETKKAAFDRETYEQYEMKLLDFLLRLLDKADHWEEYVNIYNRILEDRPFYCLTYNRERNDPVFNRFIRWTDKKFHHVHFLYVHHHRYEVICRKLDKVRSGKRTGNLYHATQCNLSDEELQQRYDQTKQWIEQILSEYLKYKGVKK